MNIDCYYTIIDCIVMKETFSYILSYLTKKGIIISYNLYTMFLILLELMLCKSPGCY